MTTYKERTNSVGYKFLDSESDPKWEKRRNGESVAEYLDRRQIVILSCPCGRKCYTCRTHDGIPGHLSMEEFDDFDLNEKRGWEDERRAFCERHGYNFESVEELANRSRKLRAHYSVGEDDNGEVVRLELPDPGGLR